MRNRTHKWSFALLALFAFAAAVHADTPLVSGQVVVESGVTRYIYTMTNVLSSGQLHGLYGLMLPDGLAVSHSEPAGWYFQVAEHTHWDEFYWESGAQSMLQPGQSVVLEVYTSSPVATRWIKSWQVGALDVGGRDYPYSDGTELPVPAPVPEPSSLLAVVGGLAGLGGFALRRKWSWARNE